MEGPTIHLHPQEAWHFDARLLLNADGLEQLKGALARLEAARAAEPEANRLVVEIEVWASDGEGYTLQLGLLSDSEMDRELPYYRIMDN